MCIIVGNVSSVSKTRIVVATAGARQIVVYANQVKLEDGPVAMILPFVNSSGNGVEVIPTVPGDKELFTALHNSCHPPTKSLYSNDGGVMLGRSAHKERLEVLRSGSYRYSVAPTAADVLRVDERIFAGVPDDLSALIAQYESDTFGFIVCILDASADFSPFAYVSDRLPDGGLFVPTRHYHSHSAAPAARPAGASMVSTISSFVSDIVRHTTTVDWDHTVYAVGLPPNQSCYSMNGLRPEKRGAAPVTARSWPESQLKSMLDGIQPDDVAMYTITNRSNVPNKDMFLRAVVA